ncbi:OmpA family protein [Variovorax sp. PAMC28562]|uniref:OmpA family protein n=1 Tax=Variovorax sp. PAMC28562 TaxID=2762323 RepID=UPI00164D7212|nr:OmpA family protein [Variovorax sp. PAMC28562]QNK73192.1 OmpA family protein [Variovorax sp. PAMC28562]
MYFHFDKANCSSLRWRKVGAALIAGAALLIGSALVQAAPAPGGAVIRNVATGTYVPTGFAQTETISSNAVIATVLSVEALTLTQDQSVTRPPAAVVTLSHLLTNTGNVASSYALNLSNDGVGCTPDTLDLSSLRIVRDSNNNGVVDSSDPVIALNSTGALLLQPGQTVALLVQGTVPTVGVGNACLALVVTTTLQRLSAVNHDVVTVGNVAVISITKSAAYPGLVIPGTTRIDFAVSGANIGSQDAQPSSVAAPTNTPVLVNGAPTALVLVRDLVPAGTQYIVGSLQSAAANSTKLYRLSGDAPFSYRTAEDASAIEVAIGIATPVVRNASFVMQFGVKVNASLTGDIRNTAQSYYNDAISPTAATSNTVVIASMQARIGVAKAASSPKVNRGADGQLDGTATVRFSVNIRNYGTVPLYDVLAPDVLEGLGASQFGTFTAAAVPAANQYAIVPGSVSIGGNQGNNVSGTLAVANTSFSGTATASNLLSPGAVLPVGAQVSVQFDVRVNFTGRAGTLYNSVKVSSALAAGGSPTIFDDSVDGADPDPDGDGNPNNNSSPTPVSTQLPSLSLVKSASLPRRVASGVFDIDYTLKITNTGVAAAPNVRVIDNLNCTFDMDKPEGLIASWALMGAPKTANGLLNPAANFTGRATCNRTQINSADPFSLPTEAALSTTDGSRALAPGQSEQIVFTVRVTVKAIAIGNRVTVINKAWAAAFEQNTINVTPAMLVAATSNSVQSLLIDPQGTVYNAVTRQPVAGALVTYTRQSCNSGPVTPITTAEISGADSGTYTFNASGSLSMTTGADGAYQFYLQSPPITGLCTYGLSVTPPAGSGYVYPSVLIPPTPGRYTSCGAIVPNSAAPQSADPTTYFFAVVSGVNPDGTACDVVHNHIPLDPGNVLGLLLRKDGSKRQAEFGDFIDYALTVTNKTGFPITGVNFSDSLPPGFAFVANSARLNGAVSANPAGGAGPSLRFSFPALALGVDQSAMVRYRVRIGVGAPTNGDAINRARAFSGPITSNLASWTVRVTGGVFSDDAFAFGKVYLDCKRDGKQEGLEELGVPGVRLYLENGTNVVTDVEGKWSLYGLKPITHVLRLDQTTLPRGARLEVLDNRNAGTPESRFVDLKKGEFHKANFIITNCEDRGVIDEVAARRAAIAALPDTEAEAQVRLRLDPEGKIIPVGDTRSLPASGQSLAGGSSGTVQATSAPLIALPVPTGKASTFVSAGGGTGGGTLGTAGAAASTPAGSLFSALNGLPTNGLPSSTISSRATGVGAFADRPIDTTGAMLEPRSQPLLVQAVPGAIDLEVLLPQIDSNALGFIGLKDGDTVPSQSINVRVKGELNVSLRLTVNGTAIDGKRVGKKTQLAAKKISAWEYIGVLLKPGVNLLKVEAMDDFGNAHGEPAQISIVAPDKLAAIQIDLPEVARADLRTPVIVKVRLVDAAGVAVTARTQLTLESDRGRWLDEDLNPAEPGTQVFMEGGTAEFRLLPPGEPGDARIRVTAADLVKEVRLALLPEMRPMIGVGIVEGVLDFTKRGGLTLGAMPAGAAFEAELTGLKDQSGDKRASGRAAFFFKGTVKGDYLLTASFDSDKTQKDRLFRDIRPDEFYPVYGDSAVKGFDAQSTQKLYVRIDKNRSYLLYGDFTTASSTEVRNLSQSNRSLTGMKHVYEDDTVRATSYVSRTAQVQQVEEFRAVGTSGPYYLSATGGDFVDNSEQIEVMVRDRNQPNIVLLRTPVARFVDYTVEPLTRRILFTHPISSVDANLNPQSIRVTYEVDSGGPKFTVAGTDVQVKVSERVQLGVVASTDQNPQNKRKLEAVTGIARIGDNTTVAAELVHTESDAKGKGNAGRVEARYQDEKLAVVALASKTSEGFDNPGASIMAGRTEVSARAEYRVDPTTAVRAEALYSKDALLTGGTKGATVSAQKKLSDTLVAEVGLRQGQSTTGLGSSSGFDYGQISTYNGQLGGSVGAGNVTALGSAATSASTQNESLTTVRARLSSAVPGLPQAQVFVEGEQDVKDGSRHTVAVGGNYAITDKTRAYARYELVSSLNGPYDATSTQTHNVGIVGIESAYMEGGRVYNEYRLADSIDGRSAQAALGVRNTFKVTDHLRLTAGVEHTRSLSGASNSVNSGNGYTSTGLGESTAITGGAEYSNGAFKASGVLEARNGDDANTRLFSAGAGYKLSPAVSLLARSVISDSEGQGANAGNERHLQRHQLGLAYRPVDTDTWNALARYEHRSEKIVGGGNSAGALSGGSAFGSDFGNANLPGTTSADIVSAHLNFNPERGTVITARYAAKVSRADDGVLASTYWAHLMQGRWTKDLTPDWDVGVQAGVLYGKGGGLQKTAGVEVGYQAYKNTWVSAGYNVVGLKDRDLTANEYTSKGAYVRLRFKFDETGLGFASAGGEPAAAKPVDAITAANEAARAMPVIAPAPLTLALPAKTTLQAETLFDFGKSAIKAESQQALHALASQIKATDYDVVITIGHTDSAGSQDFNQSLSEQRANAVRAYLIAHGVDAARIRSEGKGEKEPIASNATAQGRAQNRRVEIEVLGQEKQQSGQPPEPTSRH